MISIKKLLGKLFKQKKGTMSVCQVPIHFQPSVQLLRERQKRVFDNMQKNIFVEKCHCDYGKEDCNSYFFVVDEIARQVRLVIPVVSVKGNHSMYLTEYTHRCEFTKAYLSRFLAADFVDQFAMLYCQSKGLME